MREDLAPLASFVLKPARGAMGNGIVVISARDGERLRRPGGAWLDEGQLMHHASGILSGLYALGGQPDVAFAEECLRVHPALAEICHEGVPDYRIIVFRGVPIMAMARLPTRSSGGRANLHHGAVGIGIDLATGRSTHAVIRTQPAMVHPDTGLSVVGREMPGFARAFEIAVAAADLTGLGYVGADVVVDSDRGPMILELNARPGLAIQIANRAGLEPRLREVERLLDAESLPFEERLEIGRGLARRQGARAS
jgi:alpha-L-glutamate ligase-like protein